MTATYQAVNSIGSGTRFTFAAASDEYFVLPDVVVASTTGTAIRDGVGDVALRIDGAVYALDEAIVLDANSVVAIGENGSVISTNVNANFGIVWLVGSNSALNNAGEISAQTALGIKASSADISIENTGMISGASGVLFEDLGGSLVNSGIITANNYDGDSGNFQTNNAVHTFGNDTVITNLVGGQLIATSTQGAGVHIGSTNISSGDGSIVTNYGEITSVQAYGVDFSNMENTEVATLTNFGTISGGAGSFRGNESGEVVTNSGTMNGNVLLRQGDDTYQGRGDGVVLGEVRGAAGDDALIGASGEDLFDGGSGEDVLRGRAGDDILEGGEDDDLLAGNTGDDRVDGNQGDDRLFGNRGDDIVRGGSGNDLISGGRGDDVLTGNSGADVFVFNRRTDDDIITDFQNNLDQLDLSAFGLANVAALRNAGGIVENGAGSIIDLTVIGGDGVIYVDDMAASDWTGADFVL